MLSGKLFRVLSKLKKKEWGELHLYLQSPYFNDYSDKQAILLFFDFCRNLNGGLHKDDFSKEVTYSLVFPGQDFVQGKLEKLMTRFFKLVRQYIVQKRMQSVLENDIQCELAKYYQEKGLDKLAESELKRKERNLGKQKERDVGLYFESYFLYEGFANLELIVRRKMNRPYLSLSQQNLDIFYLIEKLRLACSQLSQKNHQYIKDEHSQKWLYEILNILEESPYLNISIVKIYFTALKLLVSPDKEKNKYYFLLEKDLGENGNLFSEEDLKNLYIILRIYAVYRYNQGEEDFLAAAFRIYQNHFEMGWLFDEGRIQPETLMNIVTLGLRHGQYEWVKETLEKCKNKIWDNSINDEVFYFNMAMYFFSTKQYEEAENLLSDNYQNFYYKLAARRMEVKLYYEQKSVLLTSKIEAYKMFIFRLSKNKLPGKLKDLNNNFIDIVRQLIHPKTLGNKKRIEKIKKKITEKEKVAEREWLLEKINELS